MNIHLTILSHSACITSLIAYLTCSQSGRLKPASSPDYLASGGLDTHTHAHTSDCRIPTTQSRNDQSPHPRIDDMLTASCAWSCFFFLLVLLLRPYAWHAHARRCTVSPSHRASLPYGPLAHYRLVTFHRFSNLEVHEYRMHELVQHYTNREQCPVPRLNTI